MKIVYGITTVPERADGLLPATLYSLAVAGFDRPRLFVDGSDDPLRYWAWDVSVTVRGDRIGNFGNWYLGMVELFCREPEADRFVMFEDDIVVCRGLREYLERVDLPPNGYCNLFNAGERNGNLTAKHAGDGWVYSDQRAYGALGLMFDRSTVIRLLGSQAFVEHRLNLKTPKGGGLPRGVYNVDGAVCTALRSKQPLIEEYIHKPSLVQHVGSEASTLGHHRPVTAESFPGEEFDARSLLLSAGANP